MSRDITVNERSWLVVTKPSGARWHVLDPGLAYATSGDVEVFTDRASAVQAMRQHDPEWEPPEDPPVYREPVERRLEREQKPVKAAARLAVTDKLDTLPDHTISEVAPLFPAWRQPEGAHDAYPEGVIVGHDGALWRSTTPDNVWAPGESGWHRYGADPDAGPQPWVQPSGSHDAYQAGDEVTHNDDTWRSDIDGNVWEPPTYWTAVD